MDEFESEQQGSRSEGGRYQSRGGYDESGDPVTFEVAKENVGRIIGRGGSRIMELQKESGAHIKISNDQPPQVQLFGTPEQCACAKALIEEVTSGSYRGGGRGGYRGGGGGYRGGYRDGGGYREGGYRDGGYRDGGYRDGGYREGGFRDGGGYREGGYRDGGGYRNGYRDGGGYRDGYRNSGGYREGGGYRDGGGDRNWRRGGGGGGYREGRND